MADLGSIGNRYGIEQWHRSGLAYFGGDYKVSGTVAENSISSITDVIAINQKTLRVIALARSDENGDFTITGLNAEAHTIVGIDKDNNLASDATTVIPTDLIWE